MKNETVKLIVEHKSLCIPFEAITDDSMRDWYGTPISGNDSNRNPILVYEYPSGDHDTIKWPNPNKEHLRGALFDAREQGLIPDVKTVQLPDGKEFQID